MMDSMNRNVTQVNGQYNTTTTHNGNNELAARMMTTQYIYVVTGPLKSYQEFFLRITTHKPNRDGNSAYANDAAMSKQIIAGTDGGSD